MWIANGWKDFEILDCSDGEKLERWGKYILVRPDPVAIWQHGPRGRAEADRRWNTANALYHRSNKGGGHWEIRDLPENFSVSYKDMRFILKPMSFKHTGLFPEQAANWDWCRSVIENAGRPVSVLNLFAYTGAASVACSKAGASVCHVDASKGMTLWAKQNAAENGLSNIRFIVDDCLKFIEREIRRGKTYDAIIMDPPSYGRGPDGEVWKLEENLYGLLSACVRVMSDKPLFFLLNSYTTILSPGCVSYLLSDTVGKRFGGVTVADELGLPVRSTGLALPCGVSARWTAEKR